MQNYEKKQQISTPNYGPATQRYFDNLKPHGNK